MHHYIIFKIYICYKKKQLIVLGPHLYLIQN